MMRRVGKFLALSTGDRLLLMQALLVLTASRLGLRVLSYDRMSRLVEGIRPRRVPFPNALVRIAWAVRGAASLPPRANCLPQALTTHALLRRHGIESHIRFGVTRSAPHGLEAHAWLEDTEGRVICDPEDRSRYRAMASRSPQRS